MDRTVITMRRRIKRANRLILDLGAVCSDVRVAVNANGQIPQSARGAVPRLVASAARALRGLKLAGDASLLEANANHLAHVLVWTECWGKPVTAESRARDIAWALREIEDSVNRIWRDEDGFGGLHDWYFGTDAPVRGLGIDPEAAAERRQMGIA